MKFTQTNHAIRDGLKRREELVDKQIMPAKAKPLILKVYA